MVFTIDYFVTEVGGGVINLYVEFSNSLGQRGLLFDELGEEKGAAEVI